MESRGAFARRILDEHGMRLRRYLVRRGIPERDADDILQEVVTGAADAWETYDPTRDLAPWLFAIASNHVSKYLRRPRIQEEQRAPEDELSRAPDVGPGPEDVMILRDRLDMLDEMLNSMTPCQRDVLIKHDLEEMPMPDVAREEGISLDKAWALWKAGRARCRGWFQRWRAAERAKGRDGIPIVLVLLFGAIETGRRAVRRPRLARVGGWAREGRGLMKPAIALIALGCMSSAPSRAAAVKAMALPGLGALSAKAPELGRAATPAAVPFAPRPPRAPSTAAALARRAVVDDADAHELLVLQAEAAREAGNEAEAVGLLLEHSHRRDAGRASVRRNELLREIGAR